MSGVSGGGGQLVLVARQEVAAHVAQVDFTDIPYGAFSGFLFRFSGVRSSVDNTALNARFRPNGGSFLTGATSYSWGHRRIASTSDVWAGDNTSSYLRISASSGFASNEGLSGNLWLDQIAGNIRPTVHYEMAYANTAGEVLLVFGGGVIHDNGPVDTTRFYFASGNVEEGQFSLYGVR